jgi:hypothetical protein
MPLLGRANSVSIFLWQALFFATLVPELLADWAAVNGLSRLSDYILKSIPEGISGPAPFVKDSHLALNHVMQGIRQYIGVYAPHVVTEWEEWIKDCPNTDDVNEYIKSFPLKIPLQNSLFASQPTNIIAPNIDADDINCLIENGPVTEEVKVSSIAILL